MPDGWENRQIVFIVRVEAKQQFLSEIPYVGAILSLVSARIPHRLVWLFAINRTTIPRIYSCSELVCAIVDLGIVGLSVMCAQCGHNLFIYLCKT